MKRSEKQGKEVKTNLGGFQELVDVARHFGARHKMIIDAVLLDLA